MDPLCALLEQRLSDLLAGEIDDADGAALRRHLGGCARCAALQRTTRLLLEDWKSLSLASDAGRAFAPLERAVAQEARVRELLIGDLKALPTRTDPGRSWSVLSRRLAPARIRGSLLEPLMVMVAAVLMLLIYVHGQEPFRDWLAGLPGGWSRQLSDWCARPLGVLVLPACTAILSGLVAFASLPLFYQASSRRRRVRLGWSEAVVPPGARA